MPCSLKFVLEDRGDRGVGIFPWFETVTVSIEHGNEFTEDEIAGLKDGLREALCTDGVCVTEAEWTAATEAENKRWEQAYGNGPTD